MNNETRTAAEQLVNAFKANHGYHFSVSTDDFTPEHFSYEQLSKDYRAACQTVEKLQELVNGATDRTDLIALIKGTEPTYDLIDWAMGMGLGRFVGGHSERWDWAWGFADKFTNAELSDIHQRLKAGK